MIESIGQRREFALLRDAGRIRRSGPLGLRCAIDDDSDRVRVAYAIGRSVGNAVTRNRVRRRLRAILSALDRAGSVRPGWYLVVASPEASTATFTELQHHLTRLVAGVHA
ncbi:MAG: ribonuclease P protein component [Acidimicrobiales bacterium]